MARILVVDPAPLSRAMLGDLLLGLGHTALVVETGVLALNRLEERSVDLVLATAAALETGGAAWVESVSKLVPPPRLLLLVEASEDEAAALLRAKGFGVHGTLLQPIDARRLAGLLGAPAATAPPAHAPADWSGLAFLERVRGNADRVPPVRVMFLAHCLAATGALVVERAAGTARVVLRKGRIMHVEGVPALLRGLDRHLPDAQVLSTDVGAAVAAGHSVDKTLDAVAIALGAWLVRTGGERGANVHFDAAGCPPAGAFPLPMGIPRLLAHGIRLGRSAAEVQRDWAAMGQYAPRLRLSEDAPESRWGLDAAALRVLRRIEGVVHVDHLLQRGGGEDPERRLEVLRALDLLCLLGLVAMDGGAVASENSQTSSAPSATPSEIVEDPRIVHLRTALTAMQVAHPVDALELGDRKVLTEDMVGQAYRDISRKYHPDAQGFVPPKVRALAESCFHVLSAAFDALRAPGGLAQANRFLAARISGAGFVVERDHIAARIAFKRAETLFRSRDWKGADVLFQEASRLDGGTWPHAFQALRAGALSRRLSSAAAVQLLEALPVADMKQRAEILVAIGSIHKLGERNGEAMRAFRAASQADPENRDAQRELRLHSTRAETAPAAPAQGLLAGMFNRMSNKKT